MPGRNLPNGIVTPEAVLLDFAAAGVGTRLLSRMLDMVVVMGLLYAGAFGLIVAAFVSETFLLVVGLIGLFLIIFGYPVVTETFLGGRTFGKMALGLRVVSTEGAPGYLWPNRDTQHHGDTRHISDQRRGSDHQRPAHQPRPAAR